MKRWPLIANFLLFIALCASIAYWAMQLFKPAARPVAAPPRAQVEVHTETAAGLFGGRGGPAAVASNYQLRGVIFSGSGKDSVAIISANGTPAQALRVNTEVGPGVTIKEVHRDYILLVDNGQEKRVELPEDAKSQSNISTAAPVNTSRPSAPASAPPSQQTQQQAPQQQAPQQQAQPAQPAQQQAAPQSPPVTPNNSAAAPAVQTAPPTVFAHPSSEPTQINPPAPSNDSNFGTPSPPLYSPGRAPAQ